MVKITVKCPYCGSEDTVRHGGNSRGIQVYICGNNKCERRRFQLEYKNKACCPDSTEKILNMAINGS